MTIDRDIYVAFRAVFTETVDRTWENDEFIPSEDGDDGEGLRPTPPYIAARVDVSDVAVGEDERQPGTDGAGDPTMTQVGQRYGSVSVNAYGAAASDWLAEFNSKLQLPLVQARMGEQSLTIRRVGGVRNLSQLMDTSYEPRFQQDYEVDYSIRSEAETQVELEEVHVHMEHDPDDPDALQRDIVIDV